MQFSANESHSIPERTYGSIKRNSNNNTHKVRLLEDDVNSLMATIDNIFEEAHTDIKGSWRNS